MRQYKPGGKRYSTTNLSAPTALRFFSAKCNEHCFNEIFKSQMDNPEEFDERYNEIVVGIMQKCHNNEDHADCRLQRTLEMVGRFNQ